MMEKASKAKSIAGMHAIAVDAEICRGCDMCTLACSLYHTGQCGPSLARLRVGRDIESYSFTISMCRQCDNPACLDACPIEGAMAQDGEGVVSIVEEACIGCGSCQAACPYGAIYYHDGVGTYLKCDLCRSMGGQPVCVAVCPTGALSVSNRQGGSSDER